MKSLTPISFPICLFLLTTVAYGQNGYEFEPNAVNPYGKLNPAAPPEVAQYEALIGECNCRSVARIDQNTWADTVNMTWKFKYIMNGMGVQDETLKEDGLHSGSIRQYIPDSAKWYVHYYSSGSPTPLLPAWEGGKTPEGKIILYRDQKAPNGMDGNYKITFYDISEKGFNWSGEWVTKDESFSYPSWNIYCLKQ